MSNPKVLNFGCKLNLEPKVMKWFQNNGSGRFQLLLAFWQAANLPNQTIDAKAYAFAPAGSVQDISGGQGVSGHFSSTLVFFPDAADEYDCLVGGKVNTSTSALTFDLKITADADLGWRFMAAIGPYFTRVPTTDPTQGRNALFVIHQTEAQLNVENYTGQGNLPGCPHSVDGFSGLVTKH